jgi:hypothetical protein
MTLRRVFPLIAAVAMLAAVMAVPAATGDSGPPTGETMLGNSSIEPAYNADTGTILYLSTPVKSPFPTHTGASAVSPLYLVEYPPGTNFGVHLNCEGVPGNCPDHDLDVAGVATGTPRSTPVSHPFTAPTRSPYLDTTISSIHLAARTSTSPGR